MTNLIVIDQSKIQFLFAYPLLLDKIKSIIKCRSETLYESIRFLVFVTRKAESNEIKRIINENLVEEFVYLLQDYKLQDLKIIKLMLEGLYNIFYLELQNESEEAIFKFESCGGFSIFASLQTFKSSEVDNLLSMILSEFFDSDVNN